MESKSLGALVHDPEDDAYRSKPVEIPALGNSLCTFVFYELDEETTEFPEKFDKAIENFLALPPDWFQCASQYLREYYRDTVDQIGVENATLIPEDADIFDHVELGSEVLISWDFDEKDVFVSIESECDWEIEHGLQITIRHGNQLARVGDCDGHLTNADAFDRDDFHDVIYVKQDML